MVTALHGARGESGKDGPKYEPVITIFEAPKKFQWQATMMAGFIFFDQK